ncbi:hypothetical protein TNCV_4739731 [Trichonephila clavipes]|nr:hypothetical protein TNCV_4739731 [Trichonephila clavipes]
MDKSLFIYLIEDRWLNGRASCFRTTGPRFKPRGGEGQLSLTSLHWVDKRVPSLLRNLTQEVRFRLTTRSEHGLMHLGLNVNVALFGYTRAFGDGPRNFEPWSSDLDDI